MQKIGSSTNTATDDGEFTDGDPQKQIPCTWVMSAWLNTLQRELVHLCDEAGIELDPDDDTQIYQAISQFLKTGTAGMVKTVNTHEPDASGNVKLGTAADADIVTSMTDTTAGRVPVVGWEGLGGYALQTTDAEIQSPNRLPTRFFIQGNGDADKRFGHFGSGVHIEYGNDSNGMEYSANMFVRADGNIIVEWLQVNADGTVNLQKQQMLFGPFNLPSAAQTGALPLFSQILNVDLNTLGDISAAGVYYQPANAGATAEHHYPITDAGTLLVTPSAYGCQQEYTTFTRRKFIRGLSEQWNGSGPWYDWVEVLNANGGDYSGSFRFGNVATIPSERNSARLVSTQPGGAGGIVSGAIFEWYDNSMAIGLTRGASTDATGFAIWLNNSMLASVAADGTIAASSNIVATQGLYESGGQVRAYSSNNPPTFDGGDWWQDNSSGWIIQTGIANRATYGTGVTFPKAFPNVCKGVFLTLCNYIGSVSDSTVNVRATNATNTGFTYTAGGAAEQNSFWVAFGK